MIEVLDIQTVGVEILNNTPRKFYIFCGTGYGIKARYISILTQHYGTKIESETVQEVIDFCSTKKLFADNDTLYVVRYDDTFLNALTKDTYKKIDSIPIRGTLVCIYEGDKQTDKCDKFLPDSTVIINDVSDKFLFKYLSNDFPNLDSNILKFVQTICMDYYNAYNICQSISNLPVSVLSSVSQVKLAQAFGYHSVLQEDNFKQFFANKDFAHCIKYVEDVSDTNTVYYAMLSTLLELERALSSNSGKFVDYKNKWAITDIVTMFQNVYTQLTLSRKVTNMNLRENLMLLYSLICVKPIPVLRG